MTNEVLSMKLRQRFRRKTYWKKYVWLVTAHKKPKKPLIKAKLTLIRATSIRPDFDGLVSGFKHIIDGLVLAGIIQNDKYENISWPSYDWEQAPPKHGFIRVTIEEL